MDRQQNKVESDNNELKRFHVGAAISEMAVYNNTVYLAGQITADDNVDITGQTKSVLAQIDALLAEAGTDKSRILLCQIYLSDLANFTAMNQVWNAWVVPGHTPPRATVQAMLAKPSWLVEMVVTAALK